MISASTYISVPTRKMVIYVFFHGVICIYLNLSASISFVTPRKLRAKQLKLEEKTKTLIPQCAGFLSNLWGLPPERFIPKIVEVGHIKGNSYRGGARGVYAGAQALGSKKKILIVSNVITRTTCLMLFTI